MPAASEATPSSRGASVGPLIGGFGSFGDVFDLQNLGSRRRLFVVGVVAWQEARDGIGISL